MAIVEMQVQLPEVCVETSNRTPYRDLSLDYLRTTITLLVLAHHSSLAYTTFAHFDAKNIFASTAPVVDTARWAFLDYAENFNDVFFMSLMFFVSGIFVLPSLRRHGILTFVYERILRLGLPFVFAVTVLMPLAYYASWMIAGHDHGYLDFWFRLARDRFNVGPPWFVWVLLLFDIAFAVLFVPFRTLIDKLSLAFEQLKNHPVSTGLILVLIVAALYLPLLGKYGFGAWANFFTSPFSFQICRIGLYAFWFVVGVISGGADLEKGILARDGRLVRGWPVWMLSGFVAYNALWFVPKMLNIRDLAAPLLKLTEPSLWVTSNVAICLAFITSFRAKSWNRYPWMDSLNRSAYVMYLVHYVFIVWTQWSLLGSRLHPGFKFLVVFFATTTLSWITAQFALQIPAIRRVV